MRWAALTSLLAVSGVVRAQEVERPRPVDPARLGLRPWTVGEGADQRILGLARQDAVAPEFPLVTPVRRLDLAEYGDGTVIALAGGFGEPLSFYLLDLVQRRQSRLDTGDGRRLPPGFGGGLGTWPQRLERGLFLVCWEGRSGVEFRAWTANGGTSIDTKKAPSRRPRGC